MGSHGGCPTCIMSKVKLSMDSNAFEGNYRKSIKFKENIGIYIEKLGVDIIENSCEVRVWKNGVMESIFPYYIYGERRDDILCSNRVEVQDYNSDGYDDLVFDGGSDSPSRYAMHEYVFLYDSIKKSVDWNTEIIVYYRGPDPSDVGSDGPLTSVDCYMRKYKDGEIFKDNLNCPLEVLLTLKKN